MNALSFKGRVFILSALALSVSSASQALTFNATTFLGASVLSGNAINDVNTISTLFSGALTVDVGTYVQAGFFYDHNFLGYSDGGTGSIRFVGAVLDIGLWGQGSNLFVQTKVGSSMRTGGLFNSDHGLGLGAGFGYRIWVTPYLDLSPQIGLRILPEPFQGASVSKTTADGGLGLTFEF